MEAIGTMAFLVVLGVTVLAKARARPTDSKMTDNTLHSMDN